MRKKNTKKQITDIDLMEELEYYHPQTKRRQIPQKYLIAALLVIIAGAAFLFSPFFAIKEIRLENSAQFTASELAERISLSVGDNILLFPRGKAERTLEEDPYIQEARLIRELPDTMVISLTERKVRAYVPYMGSYLYIDEEGRILDIEKTYVQGLPIVNGLQFSEFQLGEIISVDNPDALHVMLQISQILQKYEMTEMIVELNVSNPEDIYAQVNRVTVHLGTLDNMDQKILSLAEIIKTIPEEDRGSLDLSDPNKRIIFQYLI